jgi:hypothetical protein
MVYFPDYSTYVLYWQGTVARAGTDARFP